jgi:hypothetical protein
MAAVAVQCAFRVFRARRRVWEMWDRHDAAVNIQKVVRGFLVRRVRRGLLLKLKVQRKVFEMRKNLLIKSGRSGLCFSCAPEAAVS